MWNIISLSKEAIVVNISGQQKNTICPKRVVIKIIRRDDLMN